MTGSSGRPRRTRSRKPSAPPRYQSGGGGSSVIWSNAELVRGLARAASSTAASTAWRPARRRPRRRRSTSRTRRRRSGRASSRRRAGRVQRARTDAAATSVGRRRGSRSCQSGPIGAFARRRDLGTLAVTSSWRSLPGGTRCDAGLRRRPDPCSRASTGRSAAARTVRLPDLDLEFQLVAELLPDPLADLVDQVEDVGGRRAGWAMMKLACRSETSAPPCRAPFSPACRSSIPAETSGVGFLKMQPDDWWP